MEKNQKEITPLSPQTRLHGCPIPIIAITGGLASGKSTILKKIAENNYKIINADLIVKNIYANSKTVNTFLGKICPEVLVNKKIDFIKLRTLFYSNQEIKNKLEEIIYSELPKYFNEEIADIKEKYFFYEIPLLFEKNLADKVDYIILAYCSKENQIKRAMKRDQASVETVKSILKNQIKLQDKVLKSHITINTDNQDRLDYEISEALSIVDALFSE